ncbi:MAG: Rieske (2Fe-2S) protein [Chitinophagaceae bacterium]
MAKKYHWHKIAETAAELMEPGQELKGFEAGGKKLCLARHNGRLFACAATCPHAGGLMEEGWIDAAGNIVCPVHRYKFSLEKGRNTSGEGYFLKTFPIEERPDGIYVGIEIPGFFGW